MESMNLPNVEETVFLFLFLFLSAFSLLFGGLNGFFIFLLILLVSLFLMRIVGWLFLDKILLIINSKTEFLTLLLFSWVFVGSIIYLKFNLILFFKISLKNIFYDIGISFLVFGVFLWLISPLYISITSLVVVPKFIEDKDISLVKEGPYKFVRHPIYLAELLILFGLFLILEDVSILLIILAWFLPLNFIIKKEEKELIERYGDKYLKYKEKTSKLFPKIY